MKYAVVLLVLALNVALVAADFPFSYCNTTASTLTITSLTLSTPTKGQNLSINLQGQVTETVSKGQVAVGVLFLGVPLHQETDDLSEGTHLPCGPGAFQYVKSVNIPDIAPDGSYEVDLTFNDQNGAAMTCVALKFDLPYVPPQ